MRTILNQLFPFLLSGLLIACNKEDDEQLAPAVDCLGIAADFPNLSDCESLDNIHESICQMESFGFHALEAESKAFLSQYCLESGDRVFYRNELGDQMEFQLTSKNFSNSRIMLNTFEVCPMDSSRYIGYCLENEQAILVLNAVDRDLEFRVSLNTIPDIHSESTDNIGDRLQILRQNDSIHIVDLSVIVNPRTLSYTETYSQEYYDSIDLLGETYTEVYSADINTVIHPTFKYYYNKTFGLFAFVDTDQVLWKLD
ncbi:MAG: hypothetical protein AAFP19_11040 [Bacteroidota bacterium]